MTDTRSDRPLGLRGFSREITPPTDDTVRLVDTTMSPWEGAKYALPGDEKAEKRAGDA